MAGAESVKFAVAVTVVSAINRWSWYWYSIFGSGYFAVNGILPIEAVLP